MISTSFWAHSKSDQPAVNLLRSALPKKEGIKKKFKSGGISAV